MPAGAEHGSSVKPCSVKPCSVGTAAAEVIATIGCVGDDCMIQLLHIGQRMQTANSLQKHNYRYSGAVENNQTETQ
jgi:hypothetical protein